MWHPHNMIIATLTHQLHLSYQPQNADLLKAIEAKQRLPSIASTIRF